MSGLLDDLIPPWADDLLGASVIGIAVRQYLALRDAARGLFGIGETPAPLPPPPPPQPLPPAGGSGPTQTEIDQLTAQITQLQQQIAAMQAAAEQAGSDSAANSDNGRTTQDGLLSDELAKDALAPQGTTPDAQAAALAAMQQQIDALTQNVQDKAGTADGIAEALRTLGAGMPSMGMPSLGMPSLGGLGGFGGLGAPPVSPVTPTPAPTVTARNVDDLKPPPVISTATETPKVDTAAAVPAAVIPPVAGPPTQPRVVPASSANGPAKPAPPPAAAAPAAGSTQIALPSGQTVTAPNAAAASAVRAALSQPTGQGDVATTAYAGTGVDIPTDGADPGRRIDPADLQPGDIAMFGDHTALVAGNGQLVGADGKLQPLGMINDANNFQGFYRPTETADAPAAVASPATVGASASPAATPTGSTVLATPTALVPGGLSKPTPPAPTSPDNVR